VTGSTCDGRQTGLPVATAWCIDDPKIANAAIEQAQLDLVMVARAHFADLHYPMSRPRRSAKTGHHGCSLRLMLTGLSATGGSVKRRPSDRIT
jgi:2,4-dienoyl-CoA reductase-like NADH-dependent reductase (Old Yellow Enzyme family)